MHVDSNVVPSMVMVSSRVSNRTGGIVAAWMNRRAHDPRGRQLAITAEDVALVVRLFAVRAWRDKV
jgi:hypothetical protein